MYLDHYGLSEAPFRITPHTDFFFAGANRGATLEALLYTIIHDEGIVKICGEVGSGKTMLCRVLMERLPDNVAIVYLANPSLSRDDILYAIADELGLTVAEHSRSGAVMRVLQEALINRHATGQQVIVLIDEAHAMPKETLEEIRLLSNLETNRHKLLQLVLFGQPELNQTLAREDMRQLRERITHHFNLEPLRREDIEQYLDFRMRAAGYRGPNIFTAAAIKLIDQASQGLTRRINILADKALLAAFAAGGHAVDVKEARAAIRDADYTAPPVTGNTTPRSPWLWAGAGAAVASAIAALLFVLTSKQSHPTPAPLPAPAAAATLAPGPSPAAAIAPALLPASPPDAATTASAPSPALPATTAAPAPETPAAVAPTAAPPPPAPQTPLLDQALAAGTQWTQEIDERRWFIQLFTIHDGRRTAQAEAFLEKALATGLASAELRAYHTQNGKVNRIGLIYGNYASRQQAASAIANLPKDIRMLRPYPRQAIRLKPENNNEHAD